MNQMGELMPMGQQLAGCCSLVAVMPFLIGILTPLLAVSAIVYLVTKRPETVGEQGIL